MKRIGIYIVIVVCILSCISSRRNLLTETRLMLVDTRATEHTAALFYNLRQLTGKRVVYGQHNYEMDGFDSDSTRWRDEANRCDAYDVTGAYPALASFDFLHFTNPRSWETKELNYIQEKFHVAYNRGNVITFCWHYYNPVTGGNFYDTTQVVRHILPGGSYHATFKADLKIIAHLHGLAAKGDDGGHAGGDAVHVDGNVGLAVLQGIENGDARINLAAVAVDTHVHLPGQGFRFQKFTGNITAAHVIIVLTDVTVKKDATGIGSGYHIEKSTHVTIVLAGPSLQSLRCEIRGIKSLFQTAFSSWRL